MVTHLLELSRYIVLNPVHADMVQYPEGYLWSSYCATMGQTKLAEFLTVKWLLENFAPETTRAQQLYRDFPSSRKISSWRLPRFMT